MKNIREFSDLSPMQKLIYIKQIAIIITSAIGVISFFLILFVMVSIAFETKIITESQTILYLVSLSMPLMFCGIIYFSTELSLYFKTKLKLYTDFDLDRAEKHLKEVKDNLKK